MVATFDTKITVQPYSMKTLKQNNYNYNYYIFQNCILNYVASLLNKKRSFWTHSIEATLS